MHEDHDGMRARSPYTKPHVCITTNSNNNIFQYGCYKNYKLEYCIEKLNIRKICLKTISNINNKIVDYDVGEIVTSTYFKR